MTSFRRRISSRADAALSTGPGTEVGKRRSSLNALRHGCRGTHFVIPDDELRQEWRLQCIRATETRLLNEAIATQVLEDPQTTIAGAVQGLNPVGREEFRENKICTIKANLRIPYTNWQGIPGRLPHPKSADEPRRASGRTSERRSRRCTPNQLRSNQHSKEDHAISTYAT